MIRAVTMAHHEQVRMWECVLLTSGAAPLTAAGPLRWVPSLGGYSLGRQRPARLGPEPNGPVTRDWRPRAKLSGGRTCTSTILRRSHAPSVVSLADARNNLSVDVPLLVGYAW